MKEIVFKPIGIIHTPFKNRQGMPIQPKGGKGIKGRIEIFPEFRQGLTDLNEFSHIILLFHFHLSKGYSLKSKPFLEDVEHGIFAIRSPKRPNPIGLSIVKLNAVNDNILEVENLDIINGTPLLDIKPYIEDFDYQSNTVSGWVQKHMGKVNKHRSDTRFND